jgi:hypothetical protein
MAGRHVGREWWGDEERQGVDLETCRLGYIGAIAR